MYRCGEEEWYETEGLSYELNSDGASYSCVGVGTATDTNIVIAKKYNHLPVTSISDFAFLECSELTSVVIPNSVTSICDGAFYNCKALTSVIIPNSVTFIGNDAFFKSSSLKYNEYDNALYLGNDVNLYFALIKAKSTDINSCTISETCKIIYSDAFNGCNKLTNVAIGNSVNSISDRAFFKCSELISVTLSDSVTYIGGSAFNGCYKLESITNGNNITFIGNSAFSNCDKLASITIGNNVTFIGEYAFYYCKSLKSITISNSVTSIGNSAFYNCRGLTSVTIPNDVTFIGNDAFYNCRGLTSVTLPNSVTFIGYNAFYYCDGLEAVYYIGTEEEWNLIDIGSDNGNLQEASRIYCTGIEYTYIFNTDGGIVIDDIKSDVGIVLPTPTKTGYYFCGWYDNAELSGVAYFSRYYSITNHTLYAKWLTEEEWQARTTFDGAIAIECGAIQKVVIDSEGEKVYFKFVPTETRSYTFSSQGSLDTYGELYNSAKIQIESSDEDYSFEQNFSITYSLDAGETYYIATGLYDKEAIGTFTITIL